MSQPVSIENDHLELEVWPQFGGRISSLIDKADGYDLLFSYPDELPTRSPYGSSYAASWHAGWDECFPAVAGGPYSGHPYDSIAVPDHGEIWSLPTTAVPTNNGITTVWNGLRFGYRLTRKLSLDGPNIRLEYTLINLAPFPFHFVWALHPLLGMEKPVELKLPTGSYRFSHDAEGKAFDSTFEWPNVQESENLARPNLLPHKRGWKAYSTDPIAASGAVIYPERGRQLRFEYGSESDLPAYWGVWINTGGWAAQRQLSVQPTIGRHDQISASIKDHSCGTVEPMGKCEWELIVSVGNA
jgi:hypothetical protein